jgi:hypothetical protein
MEHSSNHMLFGVLLIACGLVWLVAPQGSFYDGTYWRLPRADNTGFAASVQQLLGFIVIGAGVALMLGWRAFGLADFLPF